jgi:hypothetical protein
LGVEVVGKEGKAQPRHKQRNEVTVVAVGVAQKDPEVLQPGAATNGVYGKAWGRRRLMLRRIEAMWAPLTEAG